MLKADEKGSVRPAPAFAHLGGHFGKVFRAGAGGNAAPERDFSYYSSESLDPGWILHLLRVGFMLAVAAVLGDIVRSAFLDPQRAHLILPYDLMALAVSFVASALTFDSRFPRFWKIVALGFCLSVIGIVTAGCILLGVQLRLFITIMVLLTATCALVPWEVRWQAALTAGFLIAGAIDTAFVRPATAETSTLWMATIVIGAVALASNRLWAQWRLKLMDTCRRLENTEIKLRKIFEACPDTICINSLRDGRYIDVNPRFATSGYSYEEVVSERSQIANLWADPNQFYKFGGRLAAHGFVQNMEVELKFRDGALRPYLMSGAIIELEGEPCAVTFASDMGRLKRTERELIAAREAALAASRAKSEFLSSMSHEIRTPMNAILGMADLLAETSLTSEQRAFAETMVSNGNALLDLINGILDLAKVESGRLYLEETEFDLHPLIERIGETLSMRAHEKGIELATRILPDVPQRLIGDPLRLRQVLINLIGNAIKFTESGEVLLTVENAPGPETAAEGELALCFTVRDTGIGIPGEQLETIFESFTQADSSVTRRYGGSGLGLTIARRLVDLMRGEIRAESEVNRGSTFLFTARFKRAQKPEIFQLEAPALGRLRVLVVDDNAASRSALAELLVSWDARVTESAGAKDALSRSKRAFDAALPYEVALIDCSMPDIDGFELAKRLRRRSIGAHSIIMMLTSENLNPKLARVRKMGLHYLVKPVKRYELTQALAAARENRESLHQGPPSEVKRVVEADRRPLQLLLVEDSPDNRMLIRAYLKNFPYDLDEADNGEVAVKKFMGSSYDLVLMDMQMPVTDGYTATRRIRSWEREQNRSATPIMALTASALEEDVRNTLEAGCTAHLNKPVKKSALIQLVGELTGSAAPASNQPTHAPSQVDQASANGTASADGEDGAPFDRTIQAQAKTD